MAPLTSTIDIDRPAAAVFTYVTDPSRFSEWQKGVVNGSMNAPGAHKIGDRCVTTRRIGFVNRPVTSEVVRLDPPRTWGVQGIDGPIRAAVDVTVEALSDTRSRLTISIDFQGHGIGRLLVPLLVEREARNEMPANLAALKQRVEQAPSSPPWAPVDAAGCRRDDCRGERRGRRPTSTDHRVRPPSVTVRCSHHIGVAAVEGHL